MTPSVRLYMKPYLVEFARCMLSNSQFSNQNLIVKIVKPFIRRAPVTYKHQQITSSSDCLEISLPLLSDLNITDNKVFIHPRDMKSISGIFQSHFDSMLFFYVQDKIRYNKELKKCMYQFIADLDMSHEFVSYEMLKKKYYRFSLKKEHKNNFILSHSVPSLSFTLPFLL